MRHRAALIGAALALGACAPVAGPSSADTVEILSSVDAGCCSTSDGSKVQNDPGGGDPVTANEAAEDVSEKAGDSLGPHAVALKVSGGLDGISPDAVSSAPAPEPSVLTRLLMIFVDLRTTALGGS
jgi:hypothetical protein